MCDQTGVEPNKDDMPPTAADYPFEVQVAFLLHDLMPDRWDGMNGIHMGKDMSALGILLDTWDVEDRRTVVYFLKHIEARHTNKINAEAKQKQEASKRRAKAGTKPGINVQG